jgi:hypothetical protein
MPVSTSFVPLVVVYRSSYGTVQTEGMIIMSFVCIVVAVITDTTNDDFYCCGRYNRQETPVNQPLLQHLLTTDGHITLREITDPRASGFYTKPYAVYYRYHHTIHDDITFCL